MSEQDSDHASGSSESATDQVGALDWFAFVTGSNVAYRGGVPVDVEDSNAGEDTPKVLSYATGYAETNPDAKDRYVDLTPPTDGESPFRRRSAASA